MNTFIAPSSVPYAQSRKNFNYFEPYIFECIENMHKQQPTFVDTSLIERTAETFGARFRDAVRYGIQNGYNSELFPHNDLCELQRWMCVAIVDAPRVWIYDRTKPEPWKKNEAVTSTNTNNATGTIESKAEPTQVTFTPHSIDEVISYLALKNRFQPTLVVRMIYSLDVMTREKFEEQYDVSITPFGSEPNEWLLV